MAYNPYMLKVGPGPIVAQTGVHENSGMVTASMTDRPQHILLSHIQLVACTIWNGGKGVRRKESQGCRA